MKVIGINGTDFSLMEPLSACIGFFDGMHRGHQALMQETVSYAKQNQIKSALICFDPDPYDILHKEKNRHIFSMNQRLKLVERFGFDFCIIIRFSDEVMKMDPKDFVLNYLNRMNLKYLVYGFDFNFGYKGKGSSATLQEFGTFDLKMVPECRYYGKKISSTRIKENLLKGNFRLVNRLLGFDYCINLKVNKCSKKGRKWLIEAVAADMDVLIPKDGIYPDIFTIQNGIFLLESDKEYSPNEILEIVVKT
mgnify:CR=1 FL=1